MADDKPALDEWRRLYQAALNIREIAPWEWMEEVDIFGVRNPETREVGFVSIMGQLGEHLAVAVYLGAEGLRGFLEMQEMDDFARMEAFAQIPQLQASFENRDALYEQDHEIITELGLQFRGERNWPLMRSYLPGYFPWYLTAPEVRFLSHVLEQTVEVALRVKDNPGILEHPDEDNYFVRIPGWDKENLLWEDRFETISFADEEKSIPSIDSKMLENVKRLPESQQILEVDYFMVPAYVADEGTRPYFPHMILLVDAGTGEAIAAELLKPARGQKEMLSQFPQALVRELAKLEAMPAQLKVPSLSLADMLDKLEDELGLRVKATSRLRALNQVKEGLMGKFGA